MIPLEKAAEVSPYALDAFLFVQRGLDHTVREIHGELDDEADAEPNPHSRHVSGRELCHGLRRYALQQYGLMARTVLRSWHVLASEDFGKIVFAMVEAGLMHKTDDDDLSDFVGVFDFARGFRTSVRLGEETALAAGDPSHPAEAPDAGA
ncbi:MAG: Minf_1886 family protein [Planctomycetota bacterium]